MSFENLAKVTCFDGKKITKHLLILNSLVESGSLSGEQKNALMWCIGSIAITESYLMGLETNQEPQISGLPIPKDTDKCKSCGAPIYWERTSAGKWCPIDWPSGESHFKTCPQATRWSNNKDRGKGISK